MTEDEAKRKWCHRSPGPPSKFERCIGSECMAWRVSDRKLFRHEELIQQQRPAGDDWYALNPRPAGGAAITWLRDVPLGEAGGFCGLAGSPS